jgi:pimeloyl-ACP methyl ester carboxylesterase
MPAFLLAGLAAIAAARVPPIETTWVPLADGERIALHCVAPARRPREGVLFVHGATFPTRLAAGFEFRPGDSWLHDMAGRGYRACGLDFLGFGASSRPPAMRGEASAAPAATRASEAATQIAAAFDHLRRAGAAGTWHLVAHSWGTIPAAAFAARHPPGLRSLTLFGPIVPTGEREDVPAQAWFHLTARERLQQLHFAAVLPPGTTLLEPAVDERWAGEFQAASPRIGADAPDRIRIPAGPDADIAAATAGRYPYRAQDVAVPVFAVYGGYDVVVPDAAAAAFLARFAAAPLRWRLRIDDATHVMHLERGRRSLYESVAAFVRAASALP